MISISYHILSVFNNTIVSYRKAFMIAYTLNMRIISVILSQFSKIAKMA